MKWRVGSRVPLNVYEGDRPVCQCHSVEDAKRIVIAMNQAPSKYLDSVRELKLNVRAFNGTLNALHQANGGVDKSLGALLALKDLTRLPNFGVGAFLSLIEALIEHGIPFSEIERSPMFMEGFPSHKSAVRRRLTTAAIKQVAVEMF